MFINNYNNYRISYLDKQKIGKKSSKVELSCALHELSSTYKLKSQNRLTFCLLGHM